MLDGLADVVRDTLGPKFTADDIDIQVEPRMVPMPSAPICVDMYQSGAARSSAAAGFGDISGQYIVTVRARANPNDGDSVQDVFVDMMDDFHDLSVAAALESSPTLGGYATDVTVDPDGFDAGLEFPGATTPLVGCTWRVLVGVAFS